MYGVHFMLLIRNKILFVSQNMGIISYMFNCTYIHNENEKLCKIRGAM